MEEPQITLADGITLLSGERFSYAAPDEAVVELSDLYIPLSHICRFAGQLPYFYSVLQHLYNTSLIVEPPHEFAALMHDTSEAFTNDIVTPLKAKVPMFKRLETKIEAAMGRKFGFEYPLTPEVHLADRQMLALEMKYVRKQDPSRHEILNGIEFEHLRDKVHLESWTPEEAQRHWLARYAELKTEG